MTFAKKPPRTGAQFFRRAPHATPLPVRLVVFGLLAVAGAAWALRRHYTHELPPLTTPFRAPPAPTYDADAGELPVPELVE